MEEPEEAHTPGPQEALQLIWACDPVPHPHFIEVQRDLAHIELGRELGLWGLHCRAVGCQERGRVVCLPHDPDHYQGHHYVFVNMDVHDDAAVLLHSSPEQLDMHGLMVHLHSLGFWRAVIQFDEEVHQKIHKICFHEQKVNILQKTAKPLATPVWPSQQPCAEQPGPFYVEGRQFESEQLIDIGITTKDLQDLFSSHEGILEQSFEGIDLPAELRTAVKQCDPSLRRQDIDRLIVYTDGSSVGAAKHLPPLQAEEGTGDTWAMVVLGERYHPQH